MQIAFILIVVVALLGLAGWVMNLINVIKYVMSDATVAEVSILFVGQVIGIFLAPLGAVLGWMA